MLKRPKKLLPLPQGELCIPVVLLGDANPLNRKLLHDVLTLRGYQVVEATNSRRILETIATKKPDLALLNTNVLGLSEPEILGGIRRAKILADIPMIIVGQRPQESILAGGDAYFQQPISAAQLCTTVGSLLARRRKYAVS